MSVAVSHIKDLKQEWNERNGLRGAQLSLAEEYAQWTIPSLFPRAGDVSTVELQNSKDSIGAQGTNHLSNRVVDVLFPAPPRTFFRLGMVDKLKSAAAQAMAAAGASSDQARQQLGVAQASLDAQMVDVEKEAMNYLNDRGYRPQAIQTAKLLIVTGNALEYHPEGKPVQVYNMRNYIVQRDLSGEVIMIMTKEEKSFETFSDEVKAKLRATKGSNVTAYVDKSNVTIYTKICLENTGKFHVYQQADDVLLDTADVSYPKDKLPWVPLCWNLITGEDYGRGLVAEYSGAFHALNVLTGALQNIAAVMGDIKFLVNPQSTIDIVALNAAAAGTYHSGRKDDVSVITIEKLNDAQFLATMIERFTKQISQAFLLNSGMTRDAERVTAEEIRAQAQELETSHGGIYSRLAQQWQRPVAFITLDHINFDMAGVIQPRIITGMESLSRMGELDAIRLFLNDLAILNGVPEDVRAVIHLKRFITIVGSARQVEYDKFLKTDDEIQADQEAAMKQQQLLMQQQEASKAAGAIATNTAKEIA